MALYQSIGCTSCYLYNLLWGNGVQTSSQVMKKQMNRNYIIETSENKIKYFSVIVFSPLKYSGKLEASGRPPVDKRFDTTTSTTLFSFFLWLFSVAVSTSAKLLSAFDNGVFCSLSVACRLPLIGQISSETIYTDLERTLF